MLFENSLVNISIFCNISILLQAVILISFRSIFKPFIFVDDVKLVPKVQSPSFGNDDPAKKIPRFQEKPDRRHELYKAHEWARSLLENDQVRAVGPRMKELKSM